MFLTPTLLINSYLVSSGGWCRYKKYHKEGCKEILSYDEEDWKEVAQLQTPRASLAATNIDASVFEEYC